MYQELFKNISELSNLIAQIGSSCNDVKLKKTLYLEGRTTYEVLFEEFTTNLYHTFRYVEKNEKLGRLYNTIIDTYIRELDEIVQELKREFESLWPSKPSSTSINK